MVPPALLDLDDPVIATEEAVIATGETVIATGERVMARFPDVFATVAFSVAPFQRRTTRNG